MELTEIKEQEKRERKTRRKKAKEISRPVDREWVR